jgi:SAM-dependent methyltransferase/uncharacterized protein YbaR (Trm112 family)
MEASGSSGYSWDQLLSILRCPACRGPLRFQQIEQGLPESREYGVLSCGCSQYPVVDGIPILMAGRVGVFEHTQGLVDYVGPSPADLIRYIVGHRGLDALLHCLSFPLTFKRLDRLPFSRLWRNLPARGILSGLRRIQLRRMCLADRDSLTAEDWFNLFFRQFSPVRGDMFSYFFYRFAQPRYLAALSLISQLPPHEGKPVLDLACGFGHLGHNLTECARPHDVVGVDRNFFQLWVAQHWIAPKNRFVCADADCRLPFSDGSFEAALCSDAFHYFRHADLVLEEIARCAPEAPVILARVGNKLVEPNEGFELTPDEYLALCGKREWRVFGENELLQRYLRREPVDPSHPQGSVDSEKWLSLVYPGVRRTMTPPENTAVWPHAVGRLAINPIYQVSRTHEGTWQLRFRFPSDHYAFENVMMVSYHPQTVTLTDETYCQVKANVHSAEIERLIQRMVVVGQPEHYGRRLS